MDITDIIPADGNIIDAQAAHDAVLMREREYKEEISKLSELLTAEHFAETRTAWADLNKADDQLKNLAKDIEKYALEKSGVAILLKQVKSTRKNLAEIHDQHWARYIELRDAGKPKEPLHTYCIAMTCTDSVLNAVLKAAAKAGASDVVYAVPQGDKQTAIIQKWFATNS